MLLSVTTTHRPARDLGYLLAKHPDRIQTFPLSVGNAVVFWPEAGEEQATACLLLDVDPIALVRGRAGSQGDGPLAQYVNDRPYVASSLLCTALSRVFGSALNGTCAARPDLVEMPLPLVARLPVVPSRGGERLLRELFEPLGYRVGVTRHPLDPTVPAWGMSHLYSLELEGTVPLSALLRHLYILIPVLDDDKHYWVGPAEVEKILAKGEGWLADHPARQQILRRALKHRAGLIRAAQAGLLADEGEDPAAQEERAIQAGAREADLERPLRLQEVRIRAIAERLLSLGASRVADLGCGEGQLLSRLLPRPQLSQIIGMDVSPGELERAERRLNLDDLAPQVRDRLQLRQGSLLYADPDLADLDAVALVEVIEHIDLERLDLVARNVFGAMRPRAVLISTPNREYNVLFAGMAPGALRHGDHRFEWTRSQFQAWSAEVAELYGYTVTFEDIGEPHPAHGAPTQLGVFRR